MLRHLIGYTVVLGACAKTPATEPTVPSDPETPAAPAAADTTETPTLCDFAADASACLGMAVRWVGTAPEMVMSHPMVEEQEGSHQSYIEVDGQQYILLSAEDQGCSGRMEATGVLREIDLGGPEGTRGSYRNYYLSEAEIHCIDSP